MAFKIGDKVEVYRRQEREGFHIVDKGLKGEIMHLNDYPKWGAWADVDDGNTWYAIKLTYLKHIKE